MTSAFWASYTLLWTLAVVLLGLVLLLYRQFGLSLVSAAIRVSMQGLDVGSDAPRLRLSLKGGGSRDLDWKALGRPHVVVFALPSCPICSDLAEDVATLPADVPGVAFVWVDGTLGGHTRRAVERTDRWLVGGVPDDDAHQAWDVSAVPFGFLVGADGRVLAKRLTSSRRDVREMLDGAFSKPLLTTTSGGSS